MVLNFISNQLNNISVQKAITVEVSPAQAAESSEAGAGEAAHWGAPPAAVPQCLPSIKLSFWWGGNSCVPKPLTGNS